LYIYRQRPASTMHQYTEEVAAWAARALALGDDSSADAPMGHGDTLAAPVPDAERQRRGEALYNAQCAYHLVRGGRFRDSLRHLWRAARAGGSPVWSNKVLAAAVIGSVLPMYLGRLIARRYAGAAPPWTPDTSTIVRPATDSAQSALR
jgi:hypothetical protein